MLVGMLAGAGAGLALLYAFLLHAKREEEHEATRQGAPTGRAMMKPDGAMRVTFR